MEHVAAGHFFHRVIHVKTVDDRGQLSPRGGVPNPRGGPNRMISFKKRPYFAFSPPGYPRKAMCLFLLKKGR
jgi:hypothetical protein